MVCCRTLYRLHKHDIQNTAEHHRGGCNNNPVDYVPLRVTDAAGEQTAAAAPLNMLPNAGPCPHCGEAASKSIMEVVRKHGKQSNDLHVQELMQLAMATSKSTVIRSHNTLKYKIGVQCTCSKQVYAEVDTDISNTGGIKGLGKQGEFAKCLRILVASGRSAEAEVVRVFSLVGMGY